MISFLSSWIEQIIVAIIIVVIFEMLIPDSTNKKYIKIIFGIFIIYVIVNPIISDSKKINFNNEIKEIIENEKVNQIVHTNVDIINTTIDEIYDENLADTIEEELEEEGYKIKINKLDLENSGIVNLEISILGKIDKDKQTEEEKSITKIEIEKIDTKQDTTEAENTEKEENIKIVEYISNTYNIPFENIKIVRN